MMLRCDVVPVQGKAETGTGSRLVSEATSAIGKDVAAISHTLQHKYAADCH